VMMFIQQAYGRFATGHVNPIPPSFSMEGGPAWINSESYSINAKAEGDQSREMMQGPMMQALLEDRFKLKIHRQSRDVPVYALTVAKGGPKLQPFREGSCTEPDFTKVPVAPAAPGQALCNFMVGIATGPNIKAEAQGRSLDEFSKLLGLVLDRPVIDRTGISGKFNIHLEFAKDETTPRFLPGGDAGGAPGASRPRIPPAHQSLPRCRTNSV